MKAKLQEKHMATQTCWSQIVATQTPAAQHVTTGFSVDLLGFWFVPLYMSSTYLLLDFQGLTPDSFPGVSKETMGFLNILG